MHRSLFREALTWFEIHGGSSEIVEHWKKLSAEAPPEVEGAFGEAEAPPPGRRRRRRRRRRRPAGPVQS
jgi:hypothetical protein